MGGSGKWVFSYFWDMAKNRDFQKMGFFGKMADFWKMTKNEVFGKMGVFGVFGDMAKNEVFGKMGKNEVFGDRGEIALPPDVLLAYRSFPVPLKTHTLILLLYQPPTYYFSIIYKY